MILLLDVGNTRLKWAQLTDGQLAGFGAVAHDRAHSVQFEALWNAESAPLAVLISSVAGRVFNAQLARACEQQWALTPRFVQAEVRHAGVKNAYHEPKRLGVDRWCALLGARALTADPVCIIDCGSAITVDVMDATGLHRGGWIVPGLAMMRHSLQTQTAQLGAAELTALPLDEADWGCDTQTGIAWGTLYTACAFIEYALQRFRRQMGREVVCLLTGGDAARLKPMLSVDTRHEPHLVLQGLALCEVDSGDTA